MSANVLSSRDVNAQIKPTALADAKEPNKSLEYHRQVLESRMKDDQALKYVSPSDEIQSPATQKLSNFRNKNIMKKSKPQTLFQKTSTRSFEAAKGQPMFADIPKKSE
ncbi:hypothetical protein C7974DRAFT_216343 [Boeremia exigua]|uniref:uncharacterized protein n=1 Tax=Boeremia exigua TaxID=749465 RepID=UPI001E8DCB54|nr:uncharacterized protein C7974DRAFT_216343 [Boeremia exigua]KAH6622115.1 hypothetical protein C7974DRAFT_216343 [Boeremia exigua]